MRLYLTDYLRGLSPIVFAVALVGLYAPATSLAHEGMRPRDGQRWWYGELVPGFWPPVCETKIESKRGEFKREIKCKDGVGATWIGEWKTEFRDGPCLIKQEAKREEFKEEIKCDGRR